ncbi:cytochrome c biogenesis heme-transporting ATPase CcmA [Alteromonas aestuariivivens]|uniref:Cytochrome c biogenesis heme-transporting ATPase CcmA n=1 Tax=Alteromonas aestuariivivens TaxID=1938339 RepID=A0A3D8M3U8_9ALTE|nr:cytochrome c biogenesis heme-transporting ATPase CcmA [Alteromonas aestuariivivens]RDV24359.1 cytochrome c biogenesis heme-transporting ATPase CcmA [Alteromonas aestuariivivens]
MSGLVADNLTCIKQDRVLFDQLSFSLLPGELVYLRGPNGAGKTSLLRILTGLSQPESGQVLFHSEPLNSVYRDYSTQLVYLGHKAGLNGGLTALENLTFWLAQSQLLVSTSRLYEVLELLGLVGLEDVAVRYLSAGQQRRVALARLWLKPSVYWLLDEPFTALDTSGIALLEDTFNNHVRNGGAIMCTSHQPLSERAGPLRCMDLEYRF